MNLHIIILAAGKGTRMRSNLPKVLHKLAGKPLLLHVIAAAQKLHPQAIHVVYGDGGDLVKEQLSACDVNWVKQEDQLGTGHAVLQVIPVIPDNADVLVLYGDVPLISPDLLNDLVANIPKQTIKLVTVALDDPTGFGRIVRNSSGQVCAIVEHKEATLAQRNIKEINTGILCAAAGLFKKYLPLLNNHNAQNEYYLTDIVAMAVADDVVVVSQTSLNPAEVLGVNDKNQLAQLERMLQQAIAAKLMQEGVTLLDPNRLDVRGELQIAKDVIIDVNVILAGQIIFGAGCSIGPNCCLKDVKLGNNVQIHANSVLEGAIIEDNCIVGPFARIRPKTYLKANAHIGNFVEVKNTELGKNSKANHLTYLGDAIVGDKVNVGAGTITCNYDGENKYQTIIDDEVFIGSNVSLVAPLKIGRKATIGAGSTIVEEVFADTLALGRARQVVINNWQKKKHEQKHDKHK
jgi:bifunctional UDP-N-acetylglucosamine pyrophosphorylase / glucosamine-1-phosphate N-acetyltransferase